MINNKTLHPIVTKLFIKRREFNVSIVLLPKCYLKIPKVLG